jgi:inhibitor of KinA sporulation pathway (predicted exonuclease)
MSPTRDAFVIRQTEGVNKVIYLLTDSEYTTWPGALESGWAEPWQHREIFQMGAVLVDDAFNEIDSLIQLVRPTLNPQLSELAQSLTNVTQLQIEQDGVSFAEALERFVEFSRAASAIICMNRDSGVFRENCDINQLAFPFREDFHRLRPFLVAQGIDLDNISSGELHKLTSTPIVGHTHDALHDCRSMAVWLKHSREQGIFVSVSDLPIDSSGYPE